MLGPDRSFNWHKYGCWNGKLIVETAKNLRMVSCKIGYSLVFNAVETFLKTASFYVFLFPSMQGFISDWLNV